MVVILKKSGSRVVCGDHPVHCGRATLARLGCCDALEKVNVDAVGNLQGHSGLCSENWSRGGHVVGSLRRLDSISKKSPYS